MNIVLLQTKPSPEEIDLLFKEFPQFLFLGMTDYTYRNLGPDQWAKVEVLFGQILKAEELVMAPELRWIHSPSPNIRSLCLPEISERGNIIVTDTPEENARQIAEFSMAALLCFMKNLFHWQQANEFPSLIWDSKWRDNMESLNQKILIQIGMAGPGIEIAQHARNFGMRVWGVDEKETFHPHCNKTFSLDQLHSILPSADAVSISLNKDQITPRWFGKTELSLMKQDSVLIVLGSDQIVDTDALIKLANAGKFRGVLIDCSHQKPLSASSPLWKAPYVIITPEVAPRPKGLEKKSFHAFLLNLRKYVNGNYEEMSNWISDLQSRA